MTRPPLYAVIPAGGAGTRLWPLSRRDHPKFLLDVDGSGRSLLQRTADRLSGVTENLMVVTGRRHADAVHAQLPGLGEHGLLAEPSPRDSMAAIGWAAAVVARRDPEAIVASFAADHLIDDDDAFAATVGQAYAAAEAGHLCTIGIQPRQPATGFGYIERTDPLPGIGEAVFGVARFVEKPDERRATDYLATGRYLWNAGMFVCRASVLLEQLRAEHPKLAEGVERIAADPASIDAVWPALTAIAIDHAVAEPAAQAGLMVTVEADFGWDDIGDFDALAWLNPTLGDVPTLRVDSADSFVASTTGTPVTVVGLNDAVVVDTGDAILVTTRAHAQRVKAAVEGWALQGRDDLT